MNHTIFLPMTEYDDEQMLKLNHDRYEVFVNGDFVGVKTLLAPNEDVEDLHDFLYEHGFHTFKADSDGDHYTISAESDAEKMKDVLKIYLEMR